MKHCMIRLLILLFLDFVFEKKIKPGLGLDLSLVTCKQLWNSPMKLKKFSLNKLSVKRVSAHSTCFSDSKIHVHFHGFEKIIFENGFISLPSPKPEMACKRKRCVFKSNSKKDRPATIKNTLS
ncbi:hypothetical protein BpHYR1_036289 [Brachionus plicatilis]|uniref:Uncharacterized protein n=1 Tax=Brachionus plicatilis TaxID=10195 RepID=A0A3M7PXU4_BRAPC|nr:hypothetical protein BpHYR1_036289 [Brachionus plicatilis]